MATLAAHDQENAGRHVQAGAAGKALNAGVKGFAAKTPGNKAPKTPFKVPLNDENAPGKAGRSVFKTNGKGGKIDENAFVTPAGLRTRAPLGMKTTNAKSQAFKTPAPPLSSAKTQKLSPRLRRPKVKVHQPEAEAESEDDVPEIEYMPPREIPLQDDMGDYLPSDWTFPKIDHATMARGIFQAYHNPIEDDGRTRKQRQFEEEVQRDRKQRDKEFNKVFEAEMAGYDAEVRRYYGMDKSTAALKPASTAPKKTTTGLSTIRARSAAAALSSLSKPTSTAALPPTKSRAPTGPISSKKPLLERSASRAAAATTASKSTIGYAQGRAGRTTTGPTPIRKPLSNVTKPAPFSATSRPPTHNRSASAHQPSSTIRSRSALSRSASTATDATLVADEVSYRTPEDVEREMELLFLAREEDSEGEDAWARSFGGQLQGGGFGEEEEEEEFEFKLPEGFGA